VCTHVSGMDVLWILTFNWLVVMTELNKIVSADNLGMVNIRWH
jgi:hypothetical protein